jgi:ferredoxin
VFLTRDYADAHYQARRERLIVIGMTCARPGRFCFCSSMGVDPMGAEAADVVLYQASDGYDWEPVTDTGRSLTGLLEDLLSAAGDVVREPAVGCQLQVRVDGLSEKLSGLFTDQAWDDLSSRCINCGICTYVCPSCHCFDIQVKNRGQEGSRFRCWDSCMYPEYNLMAGGHNTRASKRDRFRNRFLHKLEFFRERYGTFSCSGCGRCLVMCPNGISIVSVINRFGEVDPDVS